MINKLYKFYRRVLYLRRELIAYYCYYFKRNNPDQVRVAIFAQGRTGSTLLESLICASGHFQKNGELLDTVRGEIFLPSHFIRGLSRRKPSENFIFHVKVYQLTRDRKRPVNPSIFLKTLRNDGWKIIYLKRRNKVKHTLSNVVAEHRGAYHKFEQKKEKLSLKIDIDKFVSRVEERYKFEELEKEILKDLDFLQITYEDNLEKNDVHQETINKILDYLSLERKNVSTDYKKVNVQPLNELISNYAEFEMRMEKKGMGRISELIIKPFALDYWAQK